MANLALTIGEALVVDLDGRRVALVPDVFEVLAHVYEEELPDTWKLLRADGRTVRIYECPDNLAVTL